MAARFGNPPSPANESSECGVSYCVVIVVLRDAVAGEVFRSRARYCESSGEEAVQRP